MKRLACALAGLLIVALAFVAAQHITDAVMTVIVGIVMGVGASVIPTVLILGGYDEMEKQRAAKRKGYEAAAPAGRSVTVNIYGPVAIGDGARAGMAGAQQPWRQLPACEEPTVLLLPGGGER